MLLLGGYLVIAGLRRPLPLLLTALGGGLTLFLLLQKVAHAPLPLGRGPFLTFSRALLQLSGAG